MHSTTGITDQFYSNMNDEEKKNKIDTMFKRLSGNEIQNDVIQKILKLIDESS